MNSNHLILVILLTILIVYFDLDNHLNVIKNYTLKEL